MSRREGTLKLSSNIEPRAAAPLDARTIVPTLADLTASGAFPYPYVGMIVSVQSEGKAYMLKALDTTVSDNWQEIGSGGETYNQTIKWEEAQRSVKRNYIEIIDKTTKDLNDDLVIESHKEGYIDIAYSPTIYRSVIDVHYYCYDFDHFFTFNGVSGEYKLIINFVDNNDESHNQVIESDSSMTMNNGDDFIVYGQVQRSAMGYKIMLGVQNRTTNQYIMVSDYVNNIADVTLYPIFLLSSIKNTSWEPATILDNIQLNEKIINTFIGTQAEWDALTTAQKKTYGIANITDDESGADTDVYSTSETKTNKVWIDGKPIYRKAISITTPTPTVDGIAVDNTYSVPSNVNTFINLSGYYKRTDSEAYNFFPERLAEGSEQNIGIVAFIVDGLLYIRNSVVSWGNRSGYIILEYTKDTN